MTKNLYDILGVSPDATLEEIRASYVLRTKVLHPDRFDQNSQPTEWKLANDLLSELNQAYRILKDPLTRSAYDRSAPNQPSHRSPTTSAKRETPPSSPPRSPTTAQPPEPAPPANVKFGKLQSGKGHFEDQSVEMQKTLQDLLTKSGVDRLQIRLRGIGVNLLCVGILACWYVLMAVFASGHRWDSTQITSYFLITISTAFLLAYNLNWIISWKTSQLKCLFIITPLYVVKTHLNSFEFWPVWDINSVDATHNYRNGAYKNTDLQVRFQKRTQSFRFGSKFDCGRSLNLLETNRKQARENVSQGRWRYFYEEDDFKNVTTSASLKRERRENGERTPAIYGITLIGSFFFFGGGWVINDRRPRDSEFATAKEQQREAAPAVADSSSAAQRLQKSLSGREKIIPPRPVYVPPTIPRFEPIPKFEFPEQELPKTGYRGLSSLHLYNETLAPLKVSVADSGQHYWVKVKQITGGSNCEYVFIRSGGTAEIKVSLGNYRITFASGKTWRGEIGLFGSDTTTYQKCEGNFEFTRSGNQLLGHRLELFPQTDGNLETESIKASEF